MFRLMSLGLLGLLVSTVQAPAATAPKAGNYELTLTPAPGTDLVYAIIKITPKDDGSVASELVATSPPARSLDVTGATLTGDVLRIDLKIGATKQTFEGKVPRAGADKLLGSMGDENRVTSASLTITDRDKLEGNDYMRRVPLPEPMQKAQRLRTKAPLLRSQAQRASDADEKAKLRQEAAEAEKEAEVEVPKLYREVVEKHPDDPAAAVAAMNLLRTAGKDKVDGKMVAVWSALVAKAATAYGRRYEIDADCRIASALTAEPGYPRIALVYAKRAEEAVTPQDPIARWTRVLTLLARAQKKAGMADEAKRTAVRLGKMELDQALKDERALTATASIEKQEVVLSALAAAQRKAGLADEATATEGRVAKMQKSSDEEYLAKMPPFKPETFAGRQEESNRVVVMELFTGAQCPPCVAADVGFDALEKTYKPTEVVFLQYHLHIPGPDPLTNPATEARAQHYDVHSTPTTLFNGKEEAGGGGGVGQAETRYKEYRMIIDKQLEKPAKATVHVDADRQGDTITVRAKVSDVAEPSDKLRLRLALVEEAVRYVGGNKLRFHHMVVRAMPGGPDGFKVTGKDAEHSATVHIDRLRERLTDYLDDRAIERPFPKPDRPMALKHLKVIAFVQDDAKGEILQAAVADIGGERAAK